MSSVFTCVALAQPTTLRLQASRTTARYRNRARMAMSVMSATQSRSGPGRAPPDPEPGQPPDRHRCADHLATADLLQPGRLSSAEPPACGKPAPLPRQLLRVTLAANQLHRPPPTPPGRGRDPSASRTPFPKSEGVHETGSTLLVFRRAFVILSHVNTGYVPLTMSPPRTSSPSECGSSAAETKSFEEKKKNSLDFYETRI